MINSSAGKWARVAIGLLLGAILLYLSMGGVALAEVWRVVRYLRWSCLSIALGLTLLSPLVRGWRWRELYGGKAPGFWLLVRAVASGQTLNFAVPFRSGEIARVFMVRGRKLDTAGTIAFEKLLDAGFFAALCLVLPFVWAVPKWLEGPRKWVIIMAALYVAVIFALVTVVPRVSRFSRIVRIPPLGKIPFLVATTLFLGVSGALVNDQVSRSLHIEMPFIAAVVLLVILQAGIAVPSTPGKLGVFQYLAVLGLSLFDVDRALAFGLVLHFLVFLPTALMAALLVIFSKEKTVAGA